MLKKIIILIFIIFFINQVSAFVKAQVVSIELPGQATEADGSYNLSAGTYDAQIVLNRNPYIFNGTAYPGYDGYRLSSLAIKLAITNGSMQITDDGLPFTTDQLKYASGLTSGASNSLSLIQCVALSDVAPGTVLVYNFQIVYSGVGTLQVDLSLSGTSEYRIAHADTGADYLSMSEEDLGDLIIKDPDAGNTPPTITSGNGDTATVSVSENQAAVTTVEATDLDGDTVTYSISGGDDAGKFSIGGSSGVLTFISAPNHEQPADSNSDNVYIVEVTAADGNEGSDTQTISVTVDNVNEPPVITSNGGGATAAISVDDGQVGVTTVAATDEDGDTITYTVTGGADQYMFIINSSSGEMKFSIVPDYNFPADDGEDNVYDVEVTVSDGNGGSDIQTISVAIAQLSSVPSIKSDGGGETAAVTVEEAQTAVTTIQAADIDGDVITYSISGGDDAALFEIDSATGELTFAGAPDFEQPSDSNSDNIYVVEVTATDKDGSDSQTISITVTDVDDTIRITSDGGGKTADVTAAENQIAVTTVTAIENDGDVITYSISGGDDAGFFAIDSASGVLTFTSEPDYENPGDSNGDNIYVVIVAAADKDASTSQTINVTISNVDDSPIITSNGGGDSASVNILENQTAVTTVKATAQGGGLQYSISGGADSGLFSIDADSGVLTLNIAPDYESPSDGDSDNIYIVQVSATNLDGSDSQSVAVLVMNVNESPEITSGGGGSAANVSCLENNVGVTTVTAIDIDSSVLSYLITGGADASLFAVNSTSGLLTFTSAPDYENPSDSNGDNVYVVVVSVMDIGGLTDSQTINIQVSDSNDPAVIISNGGGDTARVYIEERIAEVTKVVATDQDGDTVSYSITGGEDSSAFMIGGGGELYFISAPEYLTPYDSDGDNVYVVDVSVSDGSGGTDTQTIRVVIGDAIEPEDAVELDLQVHKKSEGLGTLSYSGRLEIGRVITVIAVPASGYRVKSWSGTDGKEAVNEQAVTLKKNQHKVVVQFEEVPVQKVISAKFQAGKTRSLHDDSFDIHGILGAGADHIPDSDAVVKVEVLDSDGNTIFSQSIDYNDSSFSNKWPKSIIYKDKSIVQGKLNYFQYDINKGKFRLSAKGQDLTGWVAPLSLSIDIGDYAAFMILYDQGTNDTINGKKYMPRQFMFGSTASLTVDSQKIKTAKDGTQSGKVSGRFSSSINPLEHTLTSAEILIGDYSQILTLEKHAKKDRYMYKRSKDADPDVQYIDKATFDVDKAEFVISFKNADFDIDQETFGITFGWDE